MSVYPELSFFTIYFVMDGTSSSATGTTGTTGTVVLLALVMWSYIVALFYCRTLLRPLVTL
jgi:hypothetical protein